jgi:mono/diheme cytochrome c family protein
MRTSVLRSCALPLVILLAFVTGIVSAPAGDRQATGEPSYEQDVRPIFKANCFHCHGEGEELKGGLDLRLRRLIVVGGESGPAVVPGDPDDSLLFQHISSDQMPPEEVEKRLTADEIAVIGRWIKSGAPTLRPEPEQLGEEPYFTEQERSFWAFQPIKRIEPPRVRQRDRVRNPVDQFLLARLEQQGLGYSSEADPLTLIRRVYFDLLGIPPTPAAVESFLSDSSPDAYERLVDQLLSSPAYGERWARHWLDVAGYADSEGVVDDDPVRVNAFRYRDWVIRSMDADMPLDQFIQQQLAGDEMVGRKLENLTPDEVSKLTATGFLRMAPDGTGSGDINQDIARNTVISETIKIVSTSLLGITVGCAQCHNHRYDPISQEDYYRLRAIFEPALDWKKWIVPQGRQVSLYTDENRAESARIEEEAKKIDQQRLKKQEEYIQQTFDKELAKLPEELREPIRKARETPEKEQSEEQKQLLKDNPSVNVSAGSLYLYDQKAADDLKTYTDRATKVRERKPEERFVRALTEPLNQEPPGTFLFYRGDVSQPRQQVGAAELPILDSEQTLLLPENDDSLPTTGRRLAYARWLTSGSHPLVSRVLVNRVWMHHFGRGIVNTPGDFGYLGVRPTHPELLDWLASEFVEQGWSLKKLHRLMMLSAAYRQQSTRSPEKDAVDADNQLLSRMSMRRLDAESLRDAILVINEKYNSRRYGPPVPVMADKVGQFVIGIENLDAGRPGAVLPMKGEDFRRSVYVQVRRSRRLGMLDTFDAAILEPNCTMRTQSTVTPQALMMMNGRFVRTQSIYLAEQIQREVGKELGPQVERAWQAIYCRIPGEREQDEAVELLKQLVEHFEELLSDKEKAGGSGDLAEPVTSSDPQIEALATLCQALLSSSEFLYVD